VIRKALGCVQLSVAQHLQNIKKTVRTGHATDINLSVVVSKIENTPQLSRHDHVNEGFPFLICLNFAIAVIESPPCAVGTEIYHWRNDMLNNIGLPGLMLIAVVVLVLFGRGKISSLMGEVGKGITSFKKGINEGEQQLKDEAVDEIADVEAETDTKDKV
jgi:sec-independent protein translocase protein TatA